MKSYLEVMEIARKDWEGIACVDPINIRETVIIDRKYGATMDANAVNETPFGVTYYSYNIQYVDMPNVWFLIDYGPKDDTYECWACWAN